MFAKKLGFNLFFNVIIKFCAVGLGIFASRWILKYLNGAENELYVLIVSYTQIILQTLDLGLPILIQKHFTNEKDEKQLSKIWTTFNLLRLASYFLGLLIIYFTYPLSQTTELYYILGIFTAQFIMLADLNYRSVAHSLGRSWQFSTTDFISKLLLVVLLFTGINFLPKDISPLVFFIFVSIFVYSVGYLLDAFWQRKYTHFGAFSKDILKQNAKPILYLSLSTFAVATFLTTDKLYLKFFNFDDQTVVGYANAYKLFEIATIIPGLSMPQITSWLKRRLDTTLEREKLVLQAVGLSFLAGLITYIFMYFVGDFALQLIDVDRKYKLAWEILPVLSISLIFAFPTLLIGQTVIFLGREKYELYAVSILAFLVNGLYILLIPRYGWLGASMATIMIYILDIIIKGFFLAKTLRETERKAEKE